MDPLLGFSARAAALFSSLGDQSSTTPTLNYAPPIAGKPNLDQESSDDERDGISNADKPEPSLVPWSVVTDGEVGPSGAGLIEPSRASRRAFEDEPEEDEFDFIAAGSLRRNFEEEKPPRGMEVMADNAWDRKCDRRKPNVNHEESTLVSKGKKRVMFDSSAKAGPSTTENPSKPPIHFQKRSGRRRSYVPHHVRHPEKYICYTLDEPLIVGGGAQGHQDSSQDLKDMTMAAESTRKATETPEMEERFIPRFGSGMEFRPKVMATSAQKPVQGQDKWLKVSLSDDDEEEQFGGSNANIDTGSRMECVSSDTAFRQRSRGQRQYRSTRKSDR